jgi:hypothetical protein
MLERTRSLACKNKKHASKSPQVRRKIRPSLRNGFNGLLRALPGDRAFLPPSPVRCASIVTKLTSASRCQDHTTSPSAPAPIVSRHYRVHRIPHPTFVTIAKRPSFGYRMARACRDDLPDGQSGKFLVGGLDRQNTDLPVGQISPEQVNSLSRRERAGVRGYGLSMVRAPSPGSHLRCDPTSPARER